MQSWGPTADGTEQKKGSGHPKTGQRNSEQQREKRVKRSDSLRDGWDIASTSSHVTGVGPRKKEKKGQKTYFQK